jgi:hypothetical protein
LEDMVKSFTAVLTAKDCMLDISENVVRGSTSSHPTSSSNSNNNSHPNNNHSNNNNHNHNHNNNDKNQIQQPLIKGQITVTTSTILQTRQHNTRIMTSRSLIQNLALVERAIQQNLYHREHLKYRDFGDSGSSSFAMEQELYGQGDGDDDKKGESDDSVGGDDAASQLSAPLGGGAYDLQSSSTTTTTSRS